MRRVVLIALLMSLVVASAWAQRAPVATARFEPSSVRIGEATMLVIHLESPSQTPPQQIPAPTLPDDLRLLNQLGSIRQESYNGNQRTLSVDHRYQVIPQREGLIHVFPGSDALRQAGYDVPRVTLNVMPEATEQFEVGHHLSPMVPGDPLALSVQPRRGMPSDQVQRLQATVRQINASHREEFRNTVGLVVAIDNPEPVVGEQVLVSVYLVNGPQDGEDGYRMRTPEFQAGRELQLDPGMTYVLSQSNIPQDFRSLSPFSRPMQPVIPDSAYRTVIDPDTGESRRIHLLRQAAFVPANAGKLQIPMMNAQVDYEFELTNPNTQQVMTQPNRASLNTPVYEIEVKPLPNGTRAAGQMTVGRDLRLSASLSTNEITLDQAATLSVMLSGRTCAQWIARPDFEGLNTPLRIDPPVVEPESQQTLLDDDLYGYVRWDCVVRSSEPGLHTIPSLDYHFYNTETGEIETLSTEPLTVRVAAKMSEQAIEISGGAASSGNGRGNGQRLADLQMRDFLLERDSVPMVINSVSGWVLILLPPFLLMGAVVLSRRQAMMASELGDVIRLRRRAAKHLREAEQAQRRGDADTFFSALAQTVRDHLSDRIGTPAQGATWDEIDRALTQRGIQSELRDRLKHCLDRTDEARFAPGIDSAAMMDESHRFTLDALRDLGQALGKGGKR